MGLPSELPTQPIQPTQIIHVAPTTYRICQIPSPPLAPTNANQTIIVAIMHCIMLVPSTPSSKWADTLAYTYISAACPVHLIAHSSEWPIEANELWFRMFIHMYLPPNYHSTDYANLTYYYSIYVQHLPYLSRARPLLPSPCIYLHCIIGIEKKEKIEYPYFIQQRMNHQVYRFLYEEGSVLLVCTNVREWICKKEKERKKHEKEKNERKRRRERTE